MVLVLVYVTRCDVTRGWMEDLVEPFTWEALAHGARKDVEEHERRLAGLVSEWRVGVDNPLDLSISVRGGEETNWDSGSSGE